MVMDVTIMQFDVKDIIILTQLGIIVFIFFSNRNDISPIALRNFADITIKTLRDYANRTPSLLDDSVLDLADNLINTNKSSGTLPTNIDTISITTKDE